MGNKGGARPGSGCKKGSKNKNRLYTGEHKVFGINFIVKDYEDFIRTVKESEYSKAGWLKKLILDRIDIIKTEENQLKEHKFFGMRFTKDQLTAIHKDAEDCGISKFKWVKQIILTNINRY